MMECYVTTKNHILKISEMINVHNIKRNMQNYKTKWYVQRAQFS